MPEQRFKPEVTQIEVRVRQVVRTGSYESFEVQEGIQAAPDPAFSVGENLRRLRALVQRQVEEVADQVRAAHLSGEGDE